MTYALIIPNFTALDTQLIVWNLLNLESQTKQAPN